METLSTAQAGERMSLGQLRDFTLEQIRRQAFHESEQDKPELLVPLPLPESPVSLFLRGYKEGMLRRYQEEE